MEINKYKFLKKLTKEERMIVASAYVSDKKSVSIRGVKINFGEEKLYDTVIIERGVFFRGKRLSKTRVRSPRYGLPFNGAQGSYSTGRN